MALIWLANVILYILIIRKAAVTTSAAFKTVVVRLSLYVLAALLANFPALVNRIQNLVDPRKPIFVLFVLHACFNPLQGLMNGIVYSLSKPLRKSYRLLFKRLTRSSCSTCCSNSGESLLDEGGRRIRSYDEDDYEEDQRNRHNNDTVGNKRNRSAEDDYDDTPTIASEYDEEEEAYRHYQQTITLPRHSGISGYTTDSAGLHPGPETAPLLSGSFPNIQASLYASSGNGTPPAPLPHLHLPHHQRTPFTHSNYGSGSGFSTSEYWSSDYLNTPPDSGYLDA